MSVMQPRTWGPASMGPYTGDGMSSFPWPLTNYALDDADDAVAMVFTAPKTGNIDQLGWTVVNLVGSPTYNVALVALDASGNPTQVAYASSEVEAYSPVATGHNTVTLNPVAAVTAGDIVAVHIWPTATAPNTSNRAYIATRAAFGAIGLPYHTQYAASWARGSNYPIFSVRYDDGAVHGLPATAFWGVDFNSGTTPDEAGMKITLPMACKCCGALVTSSTIDANGAWDVCLYNSASSLIASWTCDDEDKLGSVTGMHRAAWAEQTLAAGDYYLTVKPTSTVDYDLVGLQFSSAALRAASMVPEADSVVAVRRTDGGAWTEDDTAIPWMALLLSDITFGGGSSGPRWV